MHVIIITYLATCAYLLDEIGYYDDITIVYN